MTNESHETEIAEREHYPTTGIYLIETGRCKIRLTGADGKVRTVSVIGRNDSFGGAERLKIAVSIIHFIA